MIKVNLEKCLININIKSKNGDTPLDLAESRKNIPIGTFISHLLAALIIYYGSYISNNYAIGAVVLVVLGGNLIYIIFSK